jgi:hypothetical protein
MYCNRCGFSLPEGADICARCGAPATPVGVNIVQGPSRIAGHLHTLAILWFVVAALWALPAIVLFVLGGAIPAMMPHDEPARMVAPVVLTIIGVFVGLMAGVSFFTAWGLLKARPWARVLALILGVISLVHFPIGTALGIYTLWVLLSPGAEAEYQRMAASA